MRLALFLLGIFTLCLTFQTNAQAPCAFDQRHDQLLRTDQEYSRKVMAEGRAIQAYIQSHPELARPKGNDQNRVMALYTIPVVVHVMHTGGAIGTIYNPSDAQIMGAIDYLNDVYAGSYPGMTPPIEGGGVVNMEIQFGLAQRTPSCGATNGIDRVDASSLPNYVSNGVNVLNNNGCPEITMKNLARWNVADYYNIWIVNKLDGADGTSGQFIAGFAYFPASSGSVDGTVMLATQMTAGEKTLPHEIGHALNLHHPFRTSTGATDCPNTGACGSPGVDDEVCDTDPISDNHVAGVYDFSCRHLSAPLNSCAGNIPYTINTESNFMSYTNCYTLFTNLQKARVQAAMTLPSRSSLVDAGNLALVPCGTNINFTVASSTRTEDITGTLTGCRRYRDYTYQMAIGAGPSASATATLTYSGTAVRGIDYDITTNGNFASPSNVLTFASGSTSAQSFTVRVYDDGDVEPSQTAIIDFTVNNGGGNAVEGSTIQTLTVTIADNDVGPVGSSSGTFDIGMDAAQHFFTTDAPFNAMLNRQRGQYLYQASELIAAGLTAGNITSLQLNVLTKLSTRPFAGFTIRMGQTTVPYLIDGVVTVIGGLTSVFSSVSYNSTVNWNVFNLSTPFAWDGTSNLVIEICFDNSTADGAADADEVLLYSDGGSGSQANMFFEDGINCSGSFSGVTYYPNGIKPVIRLSNNVIGTPIETVATSTTNMHIEAGSNDYFYSNNNRLLMRLSAISASLSCVNSTLEEAGTNWVNYSGGERSAKVFHITPTTNGGTADYTLALYFANAELDGKNPATLRIAKTSAASAAASNLSNTEIITPIVTTLGSGTTVFTGDFTGFSRFFLVDAGVTLPISLIDFTGRPDDRKNTILNWVTASEQNNRLFEIEVSRDGTHFQVIGSVESKGNSGTEQSYGFTHTKPQPGISWYRLKQVDWDGQWKYSNTIAVTIENEIVSASVYPVPAKNTVTVNFGRLTRHADITILSVDMKIIKRETMNGPALKREMSVVNLPQGVYFIRLVMEGNTQLLKFIKE
jgi:hypothetical protein